MELQPIIPSAIKVAAVKKKKNSSGSNRHQFNYGTVI
jgi:hypothetical protein